MQRNNNEEGVAAEYDGGDAKCDRATTVSWDGSISQDSDRSSAD